jgi:hypothetical protein
MGVSYRGRGLELNVVNGPVAQFKYDEMSRDVRSTQDWAPNMVRPWKACTKRHRSGAICLALIPP